jgi:hypothetical protein
VFFVRAGIRKVRGTFRHGLEKLLSIVWNEVNKISKRYTAPVRGETPVSQQNRIDIVNTLYILLL